MKLTKLQRYTAYCIMLSEIEMGVNAAGLCSLITYELEIADVYSGYIFSSLFPELYNFKRGASDDSYWFKNWEERKEALKQCILETHP